MFISTKDIVAVNSNKVIFRGKLLFASDGNSLVAGHIYFFVMHNIPESFINSGFHM